MRPTSSEDILNSREGCWFPRQGRPSLDLAKGGGGYTPPPPPTPSSAAENLAKAKVLDRQRRAMGSDATFLTGLLGPGDYSPQSAQPAKKTSTILGS